MLSKSRLLLTIFGVYCVACVAYHVYEIGYFNWWQFTIAQRIQCTDIAASTDFDLSQYILPGLERIHGLRSTLPWWNGTWVGQVPFWRPLTSYGFLLEYRLLPDDRYDYWFIVTIISHLTFCSLLLLFTSKLTGRLSVGLLTIVIFAGSAVMSPAGIDQRYFELMGMPCPACDVAFGDWKNQPEIWSGAAILGSLTFALYRKWVGSILCSAVAVAFKENGWLTFPLLGLLLYGTGRWKETPRSVIAAYFACIIALFLIRLNCGASVFYGYHYGHNNGWLARYVYAAMTPYISTFFAITCAPVILGTGAFVAWRLSGWKTVWRVSFFILSLALSITDIAVTQKIDAITATYMQFSWGMYLGLSVTLYLWLYCAYCLLQAPNARPMILALVGSVMLCSALFVSAAQVQVHVLYLAYAFRSILFSLALAGIGNECIVWWTRAANKRNSGLA